MKSRQRTAVVERERATVTPTIPTQEEIFVKTTWRVPKRVLKQLKQYGLDNEMTLTQVAMKAFTELLNK